MQSRNDRWALIPAAGLGSLVSESRCPTCRSAVKHEQVAQSGTPPGFWLRLAWLWQKPLPLETDVLKELLARSQGTQS
jgi:hypothetical protein